MKRLDELESAELEELVDEDEEEEGLETKATRYFESQRSFVSRF